MIFSTLFGALTQVAVFALIPFIVYAITQKKAKGFWEWIGVRAFPKSVLTIAILFTFVSLALMSGPLYWMFRQRYLHTNLNVTVAVRSLVETGWSVQTVMVTLIWACIQTSLSEEIFFRGFIAKRLISKMGFVPGNLLQALIFGAIHLPGVLSFGVLPIGLVVVSTGTIGYILGYLMERKSGGSILPGWIMHALSNILSTMLQAVFLTTII